MTAPRVTLGRVVLAAALLLVAAAIAAPYLHADRFGRRVRESLENALGRKVEMEDVRFNLLRGPGFSLRKVVIHEDPAFGVEPLAYVSSIQTRVRLLSLLGGKLEFANLRLVEPSVNLVKSSAGPWNFQRLLGLAAAADLPEIRVERGRLNFKFGDTKSAFYITGADIDLEPPSAPGQPFGVRFAGEPARTDRAGIGLGRVTGYGRWQPSRAGEGRLDLELILETTPLADVSALLRGSDLGIHGKVAGTARLSGPLSAIDVEARLELRDLHRWDTMPPYAEGGVLDCRGRLDLPRQTIEIATVRGDEPALPVEVRFRAADYLTHPRWAVTTAVSGAPLAPVIDVLRHLGVALPDSLSNQGKVDGAAGFSPASGLNGVFRVTQAQPSLSGGSQEMLVEYARVVLDGGRARLAEGSLRSGGGETARLEAGWTADFRLSDLMVSTDSMDLAWLRSGATPLMGLTESPLPGSISGGRWSGAVRYHRAPPEAGEWSGTLRLRQATALLSLFAEPVSDLAGTVVVKGERLSMSGLQARLGRVRVEGDYHYAPAARRPHSFRWRIAEIDAAELERLLAPALRRPPGLLARALGFGWPASPNWLRDLRAEGVVNIGAVSLGGAAFKNVGARVFWDATRLELAGLHARLEGGEVESRLLVDLQGPEPAYELRGQLRSLGWKNGTIEGDGLLRTRGTGAALVRNLMLDGDFRGQSLGLLSELPAGSATGCYELFWDRNHARLRLKNLRFAAGEEVFTGAGDTSADGTLSVQLLAQQGTVHLAGRLAPFHLEAGPAPVQPR